MNMVDAVRAAKVKGVAAFTGGYAVYHLRGPMYALWGTADGGHTGSKLIRARAEVIANYLAQKWAESMTL